jgi:hypothetical protein
VSPYHEAQIGPEDALPGIGRKRVPMGIMRDEARNQIEVRHGWPPCPHDHLGDVRQGLVPAGDGRLFPVGVPAQLDRIAARIGAEHGLGDKLGEGGSWIR